MIGLIAAAWTAAGCVGTFGCTWIILVSRSENALARLRAKDLAEIRHWQRQADRDRHRARQAERDAEISAAARRENREEIALLLPLLSPCQRCGFRPQPAEDTERNGQM